MANAETKPKLVTAQPSASRSSDRPAAHRSEREFADRLLGVAIPLGMLALLVAFWQWAVTTYNVPHYFLPSPKRIAAAMVEDWFILGPALLVTLRTTFLALAFALIGGIGLAILLAQSRWFELALYPYAVILQVTPIVAIAPLLLVYIPDQRVALLLCAWVVAFFPVLSNTTVGIRSTDHNLLALYELYGASRWQRLVHLQLPSALPYILAGLRIAGGLALIGSVVAEFAAGSAGRGSGLAFRLLEAQIRLNIPRLFAALTLLSATGVAIFFATGLLSRWLLGRWHETARERER